MGPTHSPPIFKDSTAFKDPEISAHCLTGKHNDQFVPKTKENSMSWGERLGETSPMLVKALIKAKQKVQPPLLILRNQPWSPNHPMKQVTSIFINKPPSPLYNLPLLLTPVILALLLAPLSSRPYTFYFLQGYINVPYLSSCTGVGTFTYVVL